MNTIKQALAESKMLIGAGICQRALSTQYLDRLQDANISVWQATSGYKFFDSALSAGIYDFTSKKNFIAAKPPNILNRVGCLVWRLQWAGWLAKTPRKQRWNYLQHWLERLLKPEPWAIDVINEVFGYDGKPLNKFGAILGEDWIYKLFCLVGEISPNSKLFICQNFLRNDMVWSGVAKEIWNLQRRGVNPHVAMQAHSTIQGVVNNYSGILEKRIKEICELRCDIHISEAAIWIWRWNKGKISSALQPFLKKIQQKTYLSWIKIAENYGVKLFTFWSPFDQLSWELYYPDQLGIFDSDLNWWDA